MEATKDLKLLDHYYNTLKNDPFNNNSHKILTSQKIIASKFEHKDMRNKMNLE